jgi:hypothetical protein
VRRNNTTASLKDDSTRSITAPTVLVKDSGKQMHIGNSTRIEKLNPLAYRKGIEEKRSVK